MVLKQSSWKLLRMVDVKVQGMLAVAWCCTIVKFYWARVMYFGTYLTYILSTAHRSLATSDAALFLSLITARHDCRCMHTVFRILIYNYHQVYNSKRLKTLT